MGRASLCLAHVQIQLCSFVGRAPYPFRITYTSALTIGTNMDLKMWVELGLNFNEKIASFNDFYTIFLNFYL